jgi:hypothetical protein
MEKSFLIIIVNDACIYSKGFDGKSISYSEVLVEHGLYLPAQTILSPQLGQNFQSDLNSKPHFLHITICATTGIVLPISYLLSHRIF